MACCATEARLGLGVFWLCTRDGSSFVSERDEQLRPLVYELTWRISSYGTTTRIITFSAIFFGVQNTALK